MQPTERPEEDDNGYFTNDGTWLPSKDFNDEYRHDPVQTQSECYCCGEPTVVDLCWWELQNEHVNGGKPYWELETLDELAINARCCPSCLDRLLEAEKRGSELIQEAERRGSELIQAAEERAKELLSPGPPVLVRSGKRRLLSRHPLQEFLFRNPFQSSGGTAR